MKSCTTCALAMWSNCVMVSLVIALVSGRPGLAQGTVSFDSPRLNRTNGLFEICLSDWSPMVTCEGVERGQFTGYQVELFRSVVARLNWTDDMYYYRCMDWTAMINDLVAANGTCFMAPAGVDVTPANYALGLKFTWPTYKQGLLIMVAASVHQGNAWDVFTVFDWTVWVAVAATGLMVGGVLWATERFGANLPFFAPKARDLSEWGIHLSDVGGHMGVDSSGPSMTTQARIHSILGLVPAPASPGGSGRGLAARRSNKALLPSIKLAASRARRLKMEGMGSLAWYSVAKLVNMGSPDPVTWGGRLVILAYGFLILIMVNYWTANTAALVTTNRLSTTINNRYDLVGKAVGTWSPYVTALSKMGIAAAAFPWENLTDEQRMRDALYSGMVSAFVLDASFVRYTASTNCSFFAVGDDFKSWYLSWAFPAETPDGDVQHFTTELIYLQMTEIIMDKLEYRFVEKLDSSTCTDVNNGFSQITFPEVSGLWIILGAAACLCLLLLGAAWTWRRWQRAKRLKGNKALRGRVVRRRSAIATTIQQLRETPSLSRFSGVNREDSGTSTTASVEMEPVAAAAATTPAPLAAAATAIHGRLNSKRDQANGAMHIGVPSRYSLEAAGKGVTQGLLNGEHSNNHDAHQGHNTSGVCRGASASGANHQALSPHPAHRGAPNGDAQSRDLSDLKGRSTDPADANGAGWASRAPAVLEAGTASDASVATSCGTSPDADLGLRSDRADHEGGQSLSRSVQGRQQLGPSRHCAELDLKSDHTDGGVQRRSFGPASCSSQEGGALLGNESPVDRGWSGS